MSEYLIFDFYTNKYFGNSISEADFPRLCRRAWSFLEYYTRNKVKDCPDAEEVLLAICALAEQYQIIEKAQTSRMGENGEIQSQTVGAYSVSYRSGADVSASARLELSSIARQYLAGTGLLYRGGCGR